MDALSSIFTWLSDHEAGISAVVGITVTTRGSSFTYEGEAVGVEETDVFRGSPSTHLPPDFGAEEANRAGGE